MSFERLGLFIWKNSAVHMTGVFNSQKYSAFRTAEVIYTAQGSNQIQLF